MTSIDAYTTQTGQTMYRVRVQRKGHKTQTATFPRLSDAKRYGALVGGQLIAGRHFPQKSHHTLSDLLEKYTSDILPRKTLETARSLNREYQWCETNPYSRVSRPTLPPGRVRFLSDEERTRLRQECKNSHNPVLSPLVTLALYTG